MASGWDQEWDIEEQERARRTPDIESRHPWRLSVSILVVIAIEVAVALVILRT